MRQILLTIFTAVFIFAGVAGAACPSADYSGDCKVNLEDFAILASEWMVDDSMCPPMDFTGNCIVDIEDFAIIASGWQTVYSTDNLIQMASGWLTTYDANDLISMADQWLDVRLCVIVQQEHQQLGYFRCC